MIEIYGDYWHANPLRYKKDDIIIYPGRQSYVKDIWNRDNERINIIKNHGFSVLIIWETDIYKNLEKVKERLWKKLRLNQ